MENDCVVVMTTVSASADWQALASTLIDEHLAACVNVLPEMDSVYRWQGRVAVDRERQLIMKTAASRVADLTARLRELHAYEVPEIIVLPIAGGSEQYLRWIRESVT